MAKKIYQAEICGSQDSCTEFWEFVPLGSFHTTKEGAEKEIEELKGLKGRELERAIDKKFGIYLYYFADNEPHIEEYDLIED